MEKAASFISRMRAVTISREYGSGGGEIATRLATRLGWQLVDHEVIVRVAQELGVTEEDAAALDEQVESLASRFLNSMRAIEPMMPAIAPVPLTTETNAYREARRRVIEAAFITGHVVIVGRGSQILLAQHRNVLHARIVAPLELRIVYVMRCEGLDRNAARARIQAKDRDRIRYLLAEHNQRPDDAHLYDMVINTAVLDLDNAVQLLSAALEHKAMRLTTPSGELGPATGMPRYPHQAGDFLPPASKSETVS
jgi:cytidylate kinase